MAKFLTHDWLQALNDTVNEHEGFRKAIASAELTLQFEVPDAPEGAESRYYLAIKGGTLAAQIDRERRRRDPDEDREDRRDVPLRGLAA